MPSITWGLSLGVNFSLNKGQGMWGLQYKGPGDTGWVGKPEGSRNFRELWSFGKDHSPTTLQKTQKL